MNEKLNQVIQSLGDTKKDVVVMGDFNYRDIDWELTCATCKQSDVFLDAVLEHVDTTCDVP